MTRKEGNARKFTCTVSFAFCAHFYVIKYGKNTRPQCTCGRKITCTGTHLRWLHNWGKIIKDYKV